MGNDQKKPKEPGAQYHPDIVIVSKNIDSVAAKNAENLEEINNKLQYVPLFYPILKSSVDVKEEKPLLQINHESIVLLCNELKNHLNTCAFNVTKDQEAVNAEIKQVEFVVDNLMNRFYEKQKKYAKYCEHFRAVEDMSHSLKKIQRNIDEIMPLMNEINDFHPAEDKLEAFNF